ncbi:MAG: EamA family transporter, partial [Gemmatimonadetes bacterium]
MAALKGKALIAYLIVCVFWGSTYLAIKVGVTELPPFLFAGLRFGVAGLILL